MKRILCTAIILLLLAFTVSACVLQQTQLPTATPSISATSAVATTLRTAASKRHVYIGAAVDMNALSSDRQYAQILGDQFDMVTPENVMKFDALHPQPGVYSFEQGDALVAFAQSHNMAVRGHNLVWHLALPSWIENGKFTRDQLLAILKDHITTVVSHYRGKVLSWDVVNEAVDDNTFGLRNSLWMRIIGPDYLDLAFRWAHEADPQAQLFYNDYDGEDLSPKSDAIYNLLKGMLQRGVPVSGVGLQMHLQSSIPISAYAVVQNMGRLAALGLKVEITEMDVQLHGDSRSMSEKLSIQTSLYRDMLTACLAVMGCDAFVMWGFTDNYTWIIRNKGFTDDSPMIYDTNYRPKQAYTALLNVLAT